MSTSIPFTTVKQEVDPTGCATTPSMANNGSDPAPAAFDEPSANAEVHDHLRHVKAAKEFVELWIATLDPILDAHIVQGLQVLLEAETETDCKIPFVGETGAGKSTLVSAILNMPKLLPSGAIGNACTAVPIEIRAKPARMTASFAITFTYISESEFLDDIKMVLRNLRDSEDDDDEKESARGPLARIKAIYPNLMVEDFRKMSVSDILASNEASQVLGLSVTRLYATEKDLLKELWEKAKSSMRKTVWQHWPLLQNVVVFLNNPMLENGLVLSDHPGLGDQNAARNDRAMQSLALSTSVCVATPCVRANDNALHRGTLKPIVKEAIFNELDRGIVVVCTKADDADVEAVAREMELDVDMSVFDMPEEQESDFDDLPNSFNKRIRATTQPICPTRQSIMRQRADYIRERQKDLVGDLAKEQAIEAATAARHVGNSESQIPDCTKVDVNTFVVSASSYLRFKGLSRSRADSPIQTMEDTEIPGLRDHLRMVAITKRLQFLRVQRNVVDSALTALVGALLNPSQPSGLSHEETLEYQATLRYSMDRAFAEIKDHHDSFSSDLSLAYVERFASVLPAIECLAFRAILEQVNGYGMSPKSNEGSTGLYWNELRAVCRRKGAHKGSRSEVDWIEDVSSKLRSYIERPLKSIFACDPRRQSGPNSLQAKLPMLQKNVVGAISRVHAGTMVYAEKQRFATATTQMMAIQHKQRIQTVENVMRTARDKFSRVYVAPTAEMRTHIRNAWGNGFDRAAAERGPGAKSRIVEELRRSLYEDRVIGQPLSLLCGEIQREYEAILTELARSLERVVADVRQSYMRWLSRSTLRKELDRRQKHAAMLNEVLAGIRRRKLVPVEILSDEVLVVS